MQATLKFKLPEDRKAFDLAHKAADMAWVISEMDNLMREQLKYETNPELDQKTVEYLRAKLTALVNDNELYAPIFGDY